MAPAAMNIVLQLGKKLVAILLFTISSNNPNTANRILRLAGKSSKKLRLKIKVGPLIVINKIWLKEEKMMKRKILAWVLLTGCLVFAACTANVNNNANFTTNSNTARANAVTVTVSPAPAAGASPVVVPPAAAARWSVAVCSSRANSVTLQAGPSKDDSATFATWQTGGVQRIYDLPTRLQNLTSVYFKAVGSETKPVELCVLFDGKPKKRVSFDDGDADHTVKSSDENDNDCRCTQ